MKIFLITAMMGVGAGIIDILPMIKMKLDKYAISSAFIFYLILPFFILNSNLFGMVWWLKGSVMAFLLALPTIIIVAKEEKSSIPPMVIMSLVLGAFIGFAGHFLV